MTPFRGVLLALPFVGIVACGTSDPPSSTPGADRRTVTATPEAGGVLTSADGRLVITIPPGAVASATDLWVESVPKAKAESDFPAAVPKGLAYELGPARQKFSVPASAVLTLGLDEVPTSTNGGLPAMALFSRSATAGDEVLAADGGTAPDGTPIDGPVVSISRDAAAGVLRIKGDARHFSQWWTQHFGNVWMTFDHTAKPQQNVGDEWSATQGVSNQGDATAIATAVYSEAYPCEVAQVVIRGSACGSKSNLCCEEFTETQINPAGGDILPGLGLSLDPPARFRCAAEGKALFFMTTRVRVKHMSLPFAVVVHDAAATSCTKDGKLGNGAACTLASVCVSGNCADGVCCDTTCTGTCQACNVQGSEGTCSNVAAGQSDPGTCLTPKACDGKGGCLLPNGELCPNGASECQSGICTDLYCCNSACPKLCMQCDVPGSEGTCTNVPLGGGDPDGCFSPDQCDGNGACLNVPASNGTPCSNAADCQSGNCVDGVCCNETCDLPCYTCTAAKKGGGADGVCASVEFGKDYDDDCPGLKTCQNFYCRSYLGMPCPNGNECTAEYCRDGVCCDKANCTMPSSGCTACTLAHTGQPDGTCAIVKAGTDPFDWCKAPNPPLCSGPPNPFGCQ